MYGSEMKSEKEVEGKESKELVEVTPLKDHLIVQNEYRYDLKKGETQKVHKKFLQTLVTEKVIKNKRGAK